GEQPAQLLSRLGWRIVLRQILVDEHREGEGARRAVRTPQALKRPLERLARVPLRREAAPLHPPRTAPPNPIAVTPKRFSASHLRFHLQDLTLLHHHEPPRSTTTSRNHATNGAGLLQDAADVQTDVRGRSTEVERPPLLLVRASPPERWRNGSSVAARELD